MKSQDGIFDKTPSGDEVPQISEDEVRYYCEFEGTLSALEGELHKDDDPKTIALQTMHVAMDFYDADWCGIIVSDMDAETFYPYWWTSRADGDMADTRFEQDEYLGNYFNWVECLRRNKVITIQDTRNESPLVNSVERSRYEILDVHSVIGAPLFYHEPCGFLVVKNPRRYIERPQMLSILGYVVLNCWKENQNLEQMRMQMKVPCTKLMEDRDIYLRLFGTPELHSLKGQISADTVNNPRGWRLITYLALSKKPVHLRTIAEHMMPGEDPEAGVRALRTTMSRMKGPLETVIDPEESLFKHNEYGYMLNPYYNITTDTELFEQARHAAEHYKITGKRIKALMTAATTYRDKLYKEAASEQWILGAVGHYEISFNDVIDMLLKELSDIEDVETLHHYASETVRKSSGNVEAYFWIIHIMITNCSKELAEYQLRNAKKRLTNEEWETLNRRLKERFGEELNL